MGKPAARLGDQTSHGSPLLGAACMTVLIGGQPAWRMGDQHTCPIPNAPPPAGPGTPHGPGNTTVIPDGPNLVSIGGKGAARVGDIVMEPGAVVPLPPPNPIAAGCPTVLIATLPGGDGSDDDADDGKCTKEGHPVNVATGEVTAYGADLRLPGLIPIRFNRRYASLASATSGELGFGWTHSFGFQLLLRDGVGYFRDQWGRYVSFEQPATGQQVSLPEERLKISRSADYWTVTTPTGRELLFQDVARDQDSPLLPSRLQDAFGNFWDFLYEQGRLAGLRDSAGRNILLRRDRLGRIVALDLADGDASRPVRIREYEYDFMGDLIAVVDAVGNRTTYEYQNHLLVRETDRDGNTWHFNYDAQKRCYQTWGSEGLLFRQFDFGPPGDHRTRMIDAVGNQWLYEADANGLVTATITPLGFREETLWSDKMEMLASTDRNGHQEHYEYNENGNLVKLIDPGDNAWAFEYNQRGQGTRFTDPDGNVTERLYSPQGALVEYRDPLANVTRFENHARGQIG